MGKTCAICGKTSGMYPLCPACFRLKDEGKVEKCETCGKWHRINEPCDCVEKQGTQAPTLTCIICGEDSKGMHFCRKCYYEYKDREIDIHVKNCTEFTITDKYGNKNILTKSGGRVRSRAEKIIADFLFDHDIRVVYEKDIPYIEDGETKVLHPDFYLPDYGEKGIIIEYNELTKPSYLKEKEYSARIYREKGFEVIILSAKDIENDLLTLKAKFNIC